MKRLIALRVLVTSAVVLSGLLLAPYVALPYERISWQRFAGLYAYNPPTPTPSETPTAIATATSSATATETGTVTPDTSPPGGTPTGTATQNIPPPPGTMTTETATSSETATPTGTQTETTTTTGTSTETATASPSMTATETLTTTTSPSVTATQVVSGSLPDLVVSGMRIELENGGACNYSSTTLGLRVTISNEGTAPVTHPFTIDINNAQLRVDGSVVAPGGTVSFWVSGYIYGINTATVDSLNEVAESNESNNTRSEQVAIPTLPPTCTPTTTASTPSTTATSSATPTGTSTTGAVAKLNYTTGSPGSYFSVTISGFPANTSLTISADGIALGTLATDASGVLNFNISSLKAAPRTYTINVAIGGAQPTPGTSTPSTSTPSAGTVTPGTRPTSPTVADATSVTFQITLDTAAPLRALEHTSWPVVSLPLTTTSSTYKNYLPAVLHR